MAEAARIKLFLLVCIFGGVALFSCSDESEAPNLPPDTVIHSGPQPGSIHPYRGEIVLSGSDPDGFISSYQYAWLDGEVTQIVADTISNWQSTKKDTLKFEVKADIWSEKQDQYLRKYTFVVRAVDNKGAYDPSPAHLSFTAKTQPPQAEVTYPGPEGRLVATVPECITIRWQGKDPDGITVKYRYAFKLYDDWPYAQPPPEGDTRWSQWTTNTQVVRWIDAGAVDQIWSFYVQAMDNAGAIQIGFEDGKSHIRLLIDLQEVRPSVTLYCYKGTCSEKSGPLIASRSTRDTSMMEVPVEVTAGDSIHFSIDYAPGKYATTITGIKFRLNDPAEPYRWDDPTPQNRCYPQSGWLTVAAGEQITLYAWVKDDYCNPLGSKARAYMVIVGIPPSP